MLMPFNVVINNFTNVVAVGIVVLAQASNGGELI